MTALSRHDGSQAGVGDRRRMPWLVTIVVAAVTLLLMLPGSAQAAPPADDSAKPTIVLVHGAFASPSSWDRVVEDLEKDGYETVAPALDLTSISGDTMIVRAVLDATPGDKILVGHSYGGVVVSNAAFGRTDVRGLVYTAAYVPDEGDSIGSLSEGFVPPAFLAPPFPPGHLLFVPFPFAIIDPVFFRDDFAQDLNPKLAASMAAAQHPVNLDILVSPSGPVGWHTLRSWYAVSAADRIIDPELQRVMAQRAGSTVVEFDDASHAGGFTHYATRFVKLIEEAAAATAS